MAEFKFEGEVESLTPNQLELISKVLRDKGLKDNKVKIETLGQVGDNYAAYVKLITVQLDGDETFTMVAKVAPTNEMARGQMGVDFMFSNECVMYNEVLPKFAQLQHDAGVSQDDIFRFPKCYATSMEYMNEIILLENLKESNFGMLDRFTALSHESVKQVLKKFATLHSLSYVLKKQDPDKFEKYVGMFKDFFATMSSVPEFQQSMGLLEKDILSVIENDSYKSVIQGSISQLWQFTQKLFKNENNSRYSVIIHGDAWNNNLMFRLENTEPIETILIDYQMSKLASPVCDLHYMIFCSTDHATRQKHYHEWMDIYHDELDKSLSNFGLKANYVYPRDQLDADLRRYSKLYFSTAMVLYSVLLRKTEDAAKLKEAFESTQDLVDISNALQASTLDPETLIVFKSKVGDLIDSFREFGYLKAF